MSSAASRSSPAIVASSPACTTPSTARAPRSSRSKEVTAPSSPVTSLMPRPGGVRRAVTTAVVSQEVSAAVSRPAATRKRQS